MNELEISESTSLVDNQPKPKWKLKKLTAKHKRIAALKAQGLDRVSIGAACGCTPEYVTMLMEQPLIIDLMDKHERAIDRDLRDLTGAAVNVVRNKLNSGDDDVALRSATLVLKANGKLKEAPPAGESAEDIVAGIFRIANSQVQINLNSKE